MIHTVFYHERHLLIPSSWLPKPTISGRQRNLQAEDVSYQVKEREHYHTFSGFHWTELWLKHTPRFRGFYVLLGCVQEELATDLLNTKPHLQPILPFISTQLESFYPLVENSSPLISIFPWRQITLNLFHHFAVCIFLFSSSCLGQSSTYAIPPLFIWNQCLFQ